ncbi:cytochrome c oxidase subunit 3 [Roseovarius sp. M141]|uniref:cytochrome c oxidase subunit 3 n=1 Tax=Roseovarius sp. M141 TaxID=2583806 RepID=UPI0020CD34BD|nr:cytochrome c oxidase subunit 3 [Roseovarius sp. M141]MCQ0093513.1 cytochrome o ubiquinol oxidase subunit III [Roseovarius sp. M141]
MKHATLHPGINLGSHHGTAHDRAETVLFGFWVFLMSDLIIFGLMFATYVTMATPIGMAGGPGPKDAFDLGSILAQTMILLSSSLTFGIASLAMRHKQSRRRVALWLCITLGLGLAFLTLEVRDLRHMAEIGAGPSRSGFLSAFWGLVPLHGLHVTTGCLWIIIMLIQMRIFGMADIIKTRLLRLGLFWHFLDLVWIGIFTIVYLVGLSA